FISICLLLELISCISVNLVFSKSLASGVPATTFSMDPRKSMLLATLWCIPNASNKSCRCAVSTIRSFFIWDCGKTSMSLTVSSTTRR
ncbi:hypothetical protein KR044_007807, partial [Drosophila immigrans]